MAPQDPSEQAGPRSFATTRWSMVLAAADYSAAGSREALESLCETYWYPIYAYIRRRDNDAHQSQDLTQEFFTRLLQNYFIRGVAPEKGKFRAFLLASCKHFLSNERDRQRAKKRGGNRLSFTLDFTDAEKRVGTEPVDPTTPEKHFERCWALTLLNHVLNCLEQECERTGKQEFFDHARVFLTGEKGGPEYASIAAELGMTEGTVRVAVHRLRRRYRELLRQEIANTTDDPNGIDEEIQTLFTALGS